MKGCSNVFLTEFDLTFCELKAADGDFEVVSQLLSSMLETYQSVSLTKCFVKAKVKLLHLILQKNNLLMGETTIEVDGGGNAADRVSLKKTRKWW